MAFSSSPPLVRAVLVTVCGLLFGSLVVGSATLATTWPLAALLGTAAGACVLAVWLPQRTARSAATKLTAVFAALALIEAGLRLLAPEEVAKTLESDRGRFAERRGPLGYAPVPDQRARARATLGGELLYDVVYTIDAHGFRASPAREATTDRVLFFGDSVTFGSGLDDGETLPFAFAEAAGPSCGVANLAFQGYGPHQMLRALELGLPGLVAGAPIRAAVFATNPGHVRRMAGVAAWDWGGPRYVRDGRGQPVLAGRFGDDPLLRLAHFLINWEAGKTLMRLLVRGDQELYDAVVVRARDLLRERYGAPLFVLMWDRAGGADEAYHAAAARMARSLRDKGVEVIEVSKLAAVEEEDFFPVDGHPRADLNRQLATELAAMIPCRPSGTATARADG